MNKVRFTIADIKGNLKFLLIFSVITMAITALLQVYLMKLESNQTSQTHNLSKTEYFVSQYRNVIFNIHTQPTKMIDVDGFLEELAEAEQLFKERDFELNQRITKDLTEYQKYLSSIINIRNIGNIDSHKHDHEYCIALIMKLKDAIEQSRHQSNQEALILQRQINFINLMILGFLVLNTAVFSYTLIYARFGETK